MHHRVPRRVGLARLTRRSVFETQWKSPSRDFPLNAFTRRPNESLHIGKDVVITVLVIKGQQVRLGITAPKDVVIDRAEVHARKQREPAAPAHSLDLERDIARLSP
jgi:carbon storage regulator